MTILGPEGFWEIEFFRHMVPSKQIGFLLVREKRKLNIVEESSEIGPPGLCPRSC